MVFILRSIKERYIFLFTLYETITDMTTNGIVINYSYKGGFPVIAETTCKDS